MSKDDLNKQTDKKLTLLEEMRSDLSRKQAEIKENKALKETVPLEIYTDKKDDARNRSEVSDRFDQAKNEMNDELKRQAEINQVREGINKQKPAGEEKEKEAKEAVKPDQMKSPATTEVQPLESVEPELPAEAEPEKNKLSEDNVDFYQKLALELDEKAPPEGKEAEKTQETNEKLATNSFMQKILEHLIEKKIIKRDGGKINLPEEISLGLSADKLEDVLSTKEELAKFNLEYAQALEKRDRRLTELSKKDFSDPEKLSASGRYVVAYIVATLVDKLKMGWGGEMILDVFAPDMEKKIYSWIIGEHFTITDTARAVGVGLNLPVIGLTSVNQFQIAQDGIKLHFDKDIKHELTEKAGEALRVKKQQVTIVRQGIQKRVTDFLKNLFGLNKKD